MKYRKKPVVIDAIRWEGKQEQLFSIIQETKPAPWPEGWTFETSTRSLFIKTIEGEMECKVGDWLVRGIAGEFYPCRDDIFVASYEPAA